MNGKNYEGKNHNKTLIYYEFYCGLSFLLIFEFPAFVAAIKIRL
jgi:hypothetical protein